MLQPQAVVGNTQDDNEFASALLTTNATTPGFCLQGISMYQMLSHIIKHKPKNNSSKGVFFQYFHFADEVMGSEKSDLFTVTQWHSRDLNPGWSYVRKLKARGHQGLNLRNSYPVSQKRSLYPSPNPTPNIPWWTSLYMCPYRAERVWDVTLWPESWSQRMWILCQAWGFVSAPGVSGSWSSFSWDRPTPWCEAHSAPPGSWD